MTLSVTDWKLLSKKYPNLWVALDQKSGKVVGANKSAKIAYEQAQKRGVAVPLITRIPKEYGFYVVTEFTL